jgi:hypothetical protein
MVVLGGNDGVRPTRLLARLDVESATWSDIAGGFLRTCTRPTLKLLLLLRTSLCAFAQKASHAPMSAEFVKP